jgi:hypothetical protein
MKKKNPTSPKPKLNKENSVWPSCLTGLENLNYLLMLYDASSEWYKIKHSRKQMI